MDDKTPPQPYKRFSSAQVYAAAFEATAIAEARERIVKASRETDEKLRNVLNTELVRLAGVILDAGDRRATEMHKVILAAYFRAYPGHGACNVEVVQACLPSGYSLSINKVAKYLQELSIPMQE